MTMTSVILTLLILARGMMPRELARRLPRSSSSSPNDANPCPENKNIPDKNLIFRMNVKMIGSLK